MRKITIACEFSGRRLLSYASTTQSAVLGSILHDSSQYLWTYCLPNLDASRFLTEQYQRQPPTVKDHFTLDSDNSTSHREYVLSSRHSEDSIGPYHAVFSFHSHKSVRIHSSNQLSQTTPNGRRMINLNGRFSYSRYIHVRIHDPYKKYQVLGLHSFTKTPLGPFNSLITLLTKSPPPIVPTNPAPSRSQTSLPLKIV